MNGFLESNPDALLLVVAWLSFKDVCALARTCRAVRSIILSTRSEDSFRSIFLASWDPLPSPPALSWRAEVTTRSRLVTADLSLESLPALSALVEQHTSKNVPAVLSSGTADRIVSQLDPQTVGDKCVYRRLVATLVILSGGRWMPTQEGVSEVDVGRDVFGESVPEELELASAFFEAAMFIGTKIRSGEMAAPPVTRLGQRPWDPAQLSGSWGGRYFYNTGQTDPEFSVDFNFLNLGCHVTATGSDVVGQSNWKGSWDTQTNVLELTKNYSAGGPSWRYHAILTPFGMAGTWGDALWGGPFFAWKRNV